MDLFLLTREQLEVITRVQSLMHTVDSGFLNCIAFTIGFMSYINVEEMRIILKENPELLFGYSSFDGDIGERVSAAAVFYASNYKLRYIYDTGNEKDDDFAKAGLLERIEYLLNPSQQEVRTNCSNRAKEPMICFPCAATFKPEIQKQFQVFKKFAGDYLRNVDLAG